VTRFQEAFEQYEKHRLTGEEAGELLALIASSRLSRS
jgi:hypothetical protein